jgi:hypothetical protein
VGKTLDDLTDIDLSALLPAIAKAIERLAPSNEMFGDGIRLAGLDLLSRLHIREGMALCITVAEPARWGAGDRLKRCLEYLPRYGTHAKAMLPQLREMQAALLANPSHAKHAALVEKAIATIESSTAAPELVSLREFTAR